MKHRGKILIACVAVLWPFVLRGAVFLSVDVPSVHVAPGAQFEVVLSLQIAGSEEVEAVSYYWLSDSAASGFFSLMDRETEGGVFDIPFYETSAILENPDLDPRNNLDLGGIASEGPATSGVWLVASYRFSVAASAAPGSYEIAIFSAPGTGWASAPPQAGDYPFDAPTNFRVFVIPEPSSFLLLAGGAGILFAVSRRVCGRRKA